MKKIRLRQEVAWFAEKMELALRRNDKKYNGSSWKTASVDELIPWLEQHTRKLKERKAQGKGNQQIIYDAADIGNFAMMIADIALLCRAPPLSEAEKEALVRGGFDLEPNTTRGFASELFDTICRESLTVSQAAARIGSTENEIKRRVEEFSDLYAIKVNGEWLLPAFQFTGNRVVPNLPYVIPHLRKELHPVSVYTWFTTPHCDLEQGESRFSPIEWLSHNYYFGRLLTIDPDLFWPIIRD